MPYETGSSANTSTLIAAIAAFAQTCGWTLHYSDPSHVIISRGNGYTTRFSAASSSDIAVVGQNPYNSGLSPTGQSGQSGDNSYSRTNKLTGPYAVTHFFGNSASDVDSFIHVVVQTSGGFYRHFGCGGMRTFGEVITGHYVYGTRCVFDNSQDGIDAGYPFSSDYYCTQVKVAYDGINDWEESGNKLYFYNDSRSSTTEYNFASGYTQRAVLHQSLPALGRANGSSLLGIIPNVRCLSLEYLSPNEVITLGSDQWKVFPVLNRNGAIGQENSGLSGIAYKL